MRTMMKHLTMATSVALLLAVGSASAVGRVESGAERAISSIELRSGDEDASTLGWRPSCPVCDDHCCGG
jgi:hypothetical protein